MQTKVYLRLSTLWSQQQQQQEIEKEIKKIKNKKKEEEEERKSNCQTIHQLLTTDLKVNLKKKRRKSKQKKTTNTHVRKLSCQYVFEKEQERKQTLLVGCLKATLVHRAYFPQIPTACNFLLHFCYLSLTVLHPW